MRKAATRNLLRSVAAVTLSGCSLFTNLSSLDDPGDTSAPRTETSAIPDGSADAASPFDAARADAGSCSFRAVRGGPTAATTGGGPGPAWVFEGSLASEDDRGAHVDLTGTGTSNSVSEALIATGLGLGVPAGAEIRGATVRIRRRAPKSSNEDVRDDDVRLTVNGQPAGDSRAAHPWTDDFLEIEYGGPTDFWGIPLTHALVNQSSFGVILRAKNFGSAGEAIVEKIEVEVTFCE